MNVDTGSWKNRPLTPGKGLSLRVEPRGIYTNVATARGFPEKAVDPTGGPLVGWRGEYFGALSLAQ